jgi:DNA-binding response OmpR family regulator
LRRTRQAAHTEEIYLDAEIEIEFAQWLVKLRGEPVSLTPLEFKLLAAFVRHPNQVLSPAQLVELVWNDPLRASSGQVKLYVSYLRRKIGADLIETVRGFGYRYRCVA